MAIAGAVILCKTWRVLEVKRGGRDRKELAMVGSGGTTALRAKPTACLRRWPRAAVLLRVGTAATAAAGAAMAFVGFDVAMEFFTVRAIACDCVRLHACNQARAGAQRCVTCVDPPNLSSSLSS